jgi:hypothetical protein
MWQPAIFGGFPGRSSGFTQNANDAAFLMTALAALLLPAGSGERLHRFATYGVMIAFAAVLFSQSRTGFLCAVLLVAGLVVAARKASSLPKAHPAFVVSYIGVIVATLLLSPVLNVTDEQIMERNARHAEAAKRNVTGSPAKATPQNLGDPNFDKGVVTMKERIQARASIDSSVSLRFAAISFFSGIVKEHPFGLGTGFTNKFWTGPHNMWLKLATDEGIAAAILFTLMLGAACWQAVKTRSVVLLLMSAIALTASLFTQTVVVSPLIPALLAISMGMTQVSPQKRAMTFSEKHLASSLDQSLMAAIRRHYLALLLGPIIAALLFYALNPELPGMYVSKAYVRLDGANAESLSLERTNYAVTDLLLGGLPETKEKSIPTRAYHLMNFIELVDAEAPGSTATERLYRLEMTHKDPVVAQSINRQMLEGWLAKHPSLDRSIIVVAPDLPTKTARTSRALAAVFAGIAAAAVLLFVAGWKPLFRSLREWRYGLEWR